jgi:hypothetical protein
MSSKALQPSASLLYDEDFFLWTIETANLLRAGRFSELDAEHAAEEIEDMGKSQRREVSGRLVIVLTHLLKWKCQPAKRSRGWQSTLATQRRELRKLFQQSPSLRRTVAPALAEEYSDAVRQAGIQTGLPAGTFPPVCPFTAEQILDQDFLPD